MAYRPGFSSQHWKSRLQANIPVIIPVLRAEGGRIRSSESHWLPNTSLMDETQSQKSRQIENSNNNECPVIMTMSVRS